MSAEQDTTLGLIAAAALAAILWFGPIREYRDQAKKTARSVFIADCIDISSRAECDAALREFEQ